MGHHKKRYNDNENVESSSDVTETGLFQKCVSIIKRNQLPILLFIACFLVYNSYTYINTMSGDTLPAIYLPFSISHYGDVYFEHYDTLNLGMNSYAFTMVQDHLLSIFPVVIPVLITPFVFVTTFGMGACEFTVYAGYLARTVAAGIAALAVVMMFLVLERLVSRRIALVGTALFAFATSTWSISSQALWQHGMIELLLLLMIYVLFRNEEVPARKNLIFLGVLSGLFLFCRPPDAILLIPVLAYVIFLSRRSVPYYFLFFGAAGLPFLIYNLYYFGSVFGGYVQNFEKFDISLNFVPNFIGLIIAPNKGILVFSPILVLAVFGYFTLRSVSNENIRRTLMFFGPVILLSTLAYSFFSDWGGGYSYGPRYLTGILPALIIYLSIFLSDFASKFQPVVRDYLKVALIAGLVAVSIIIQFIGVFYFPYLGYDKFPEPWDFANPVIPGSIADGMEKIDTFAVQSIPPLPPILYFSSTGKQYEDLGYTATCRKDYASAVVFYTKALERNNQSQTDWNNLGVSQNKIGDNEGALHSFEESLDLNPNDPYTWLNKAWVLMELHRYDESLAAIDQALLLDPNLNPAYTMREQVLAGMGS